MTRSGEIPRVSRSHQDLLELERKPSEASLTGREKSDSAKKRRQEKERKDERVSAPQSPMSLSTPNPPFAAGTRSPSQAQLGALSRNGSSASLSGDLPVLHHAGYGTFFFLLTGPYALQAPTRSGILPSGNANLTSSAPLSMTRS